MANNLTGAYDAVLLVRVKNINAILATLHQNGADEDASPTFPHSIITRIGDPPRILHPPVADFAGWFNELFMESNRGAEGGAPASFNQSPPGAGKILQAAFEDLQKARAEVISPPTGFTVRGTVRAQLSVPAISLPVGSNSQVTVHVHTQARYTGDPGTVALPEPVHGEIRVTYSVRVKPMFQLGSANKILEVNLLQDESKIQFHPAPGTNLTPFDFAQLLAQIRKAVREAIEPVNTRVPDDFPFREFKELGGGQTLALPLSLTPGVPPPPQSINTIANHFLNEDFSIGISKEFVEKQLKPTLENLKKFRQSFDIRISLGIFSFGITTYHVSVSSAELEWKSGSIDLVIRAAATASGAPDYDITVRQGLALQVNPGTQRVILRASNNDLHVSVSGTGGGFLENRIRNGIIPVRDSEVPGAEDMMNAQLTGPNGAGARLNEGLKSIDDSAAAAFTAVRVTPDGLILDGRISTKGRSKPCVMFAETTGGDGFTAFESWIPGGRIDRFEWSWSLQNPVAVWGQQVAGAVDDHRFILPRPSPPPGPGRLQVGEVCLRIEGVQTDPRGNEVQVSGGKACSVGTPEVAWRMPPWVETLVTPVWHPGIAADSILEDGIAAHVTLLPEHRPPRGSTANCVVHFAGPEMDRPLNFLGEALGRLKGRNIPILVTLVLPPGTFKARRRDLEERLGILREGLPARLLLTEDYTGGWTRSFGAGRPPATYLLSGTGEFVWKQEGKPDGEALAKAMEEFFVSGTNADFRPVRAVSTPCGQAPRVLFTDDRGQILALRKLRGHPVLLNFWLSWSAPCIRELRRLQGLHQGSETGAPVIVAVNGGEKEEVLSEVRRKYQLGFMLVPDEGRRIARQFGIRCWPTTLSINPEGVVEGTQFGMDRQNPAGGRGDIVEVQQPEAKGD